jgi:hypothetical protein
MRNIPHPYKGNASHRHGGVLIGKTEEPTPGQRIVRPLKGLTVLGTVKGLVRDADLAERTFQEVDPSAVALHISPEELLGLEAVVKGEIEEVPLSSYEMVYAKKLSGFGEVQVPSPSLVKIFKKAKEKEIPVIPLDMNEETYSDVYIEKISGISMIRTSLKLKGVNRKRFKSKTAEEFSLEWDRAVNSKAYMKLESFRENHMADEIGKALSKYSPLLCVVEFERMKGIVSRIHGKNQ